ncbi:MAG: hypothetical protein Q8917_19155 [Bacillota bacterium]|nr:hypothetical protein [Bacillota bacterium]
MKTLFRSFEMFLRQIWEDEMLVAVFIAPLLVACMFRFGLPSLESLLCGRFHQVSILSGYYLLFDLFLSILTPYMFCFASAMVMLTEYDENMTNYIAVTPIGRKGYLVSRLVFPSVISLVVSLLLMHWFTLAAWTFAVIVIACLLNCIISIIAALFIFSFSHNRVEGLAVGKLSALIMAGLPVPFFLTSKVQYLFSFLPSFWITKLCLTNNLLFVLPAIAVSALWIWALYRKFVRKLN